MAAQPQSAPTQSPAQRPLHAPRSRFLARLIDRTAVYGPVRTVVWEGRSRKAPPYPDQDNLCDLSVILRSSRRYDCRAACAVRDRSSPMTKQISPLRQRMIDDMKFRNMSPNTQKVYTYAV